MPHTGTYLHNSETLTLVRPMTMSSAISYRVFLLFSGVGKVKEVKTSSFLHRIMLLSYFPGFLTKGVKLLVLSYVWPIQYNIG